MTLSSSNLNEIANLYESIVSSEQEVLNEGQYDASTIRAAQDAAARAEASRNKKRSQQNTAIQASKDRERSAAPAGSSPKQMQQAAIQGMLDRQKARGGPNNGWNKDNLTKAINPKYTPQNIAKAQQAVGIKPAINPNSPRQESPQPQRRTAASTSPAAPKVVPSKPQASEPKLSAMDQWAKANPKLAAAAAEKARIRGTQQTDNPLMKDMRSSLPMKSPSVQAPEVAKLGAGNQSLTQNPNAFKAAPEVKKTAAIAATKTPAPVAPAKTQIAAGYEYEDAYDLVLDYLLENGHVDTVDEAHYVMLEMDSKMIKSIVEGGVGFTIPSRIDDFNNRRDELKNRYKQDVGPRIPGPSGGGQYGEPPAPKATGVRLARGTSSSNRGKESKNQA